MINLLLLSSIISYLTYADASVVKNLEVCFVILTHPYECHDVLFEQKEKDISNQAEKINHFNVKISKSYHLNEVGHWTIFPLLEKLSSCELTFFLEEYTEINLQKLHEVFRKYNSSQEVFVGYALQDIDPTIIHHFTGSSLLYPHFSAGFFISLPLATRLLSRLPVDDEYSFSIDPKYEFAKFVWDNGQGVKLKHESQLCLEKSEENCATWIKEEFPDCGLPVLSEDLSVAVKSCHKFHHDRINIVKNTWASQAKNLKIFSDYEDNSIPTIKVNVENVAHGHCEKTLFIMRYYLENNISLHWLAIVDDDTIISIQRLRKLLTCYNAYEVIVIGERYGYGVANGVGYDYITGGGGMIFSLPAIKLLIETCECPSIDSPDDMIIGMCFKRLEIPVIHSPCFHQARPNDYSPEFLKPLKHISFHKHWMIDPYSVYQEWLQDAPADELHTEL